MSEGLSLRATELMIEFKLTLEQAQVLDAALRQSVAEARQAENEKCRELIGARVGATQ